MRLRSSNVTSPAIFSWDAITALHIHIITHTPNYAIASRPNRIVCQSVAKELLNVFCTVPSVLSAFISTQLYAVICRPFTFSTVWRYAPKFSQEDHVCDMCSGTDIFVAALSLASIYNDYKMCGAIVKDYGRVYIHLYHMWNWGELLFELWSPRLETYVV